MIHAMATISDLTKRVELLEMENLVLQEALKEIQGYLVRSQIPSNHGPLSVMLQITKNVLSQTLHTDTAAKRIKALEAVAEAARAFAYDPEQKDRSGISLHVEYSECKNLCEALQNLEQSDKECKK